MNQDRSKDRSKDRNKGWRYCELIRRSVKAAVPVRLVGRNKNQHTFAIRMPVTDQEELFTIPSKFVKANIIPIQLGKALDYWVTMNKAMELSRDFRPFSRDLSPFDYDEIRRFNVDHMRPNPNFEGAWIKSRSNKINRWLNSIDYGSWATDLSKAIYGS